MSTTATTKQIVVDPFCFRQFRETEASKTYSGTVFDLTIAEFEEIVNQHYDPSQLQNGYAPFCKHIFLPNDGLCETARVNVLPITPENEHLLRTRYHARTEAELPVLERFFPSESFPKDQLPVAKYLDLILYSREQIQKENAAQGETNDDSVTAPWGIVSIKAQDRNTELPMNPITSMRNALGKAEGGSGVPMDRKQYMEAVEYWTGHAVVF